MDVVFSLQRLGEDAVFSLQFLSGEEVTTGGGFPARTAAPESRRRAIERAEQPEALARAEEIAEAAVARAAVPPRSLAQLAESEQAAPVSLLQVMQLWVSPAEQSPTVQTVVEFVDTPGPTLAQLDEDAILAATVLLFSRRG
jgi:hypothetical protein